MKRWVGSSLWWLAVGGLVAGCAATGSQTVDGAAAPEAEARPDPEPDETPDMAPAPGSQAPGDPADAEPAAQERVDPAEMARKAEAGRAVQAALSKNDRSQVLAALQSAAAQYPSDPYAPYNAGVLLERQGRYKEAAKAYQEALAADPKFVPAIENWGNLELRQGNGGKAEQILLQGIQRLPAEARLRNRLIAIWIATGKTSQAEKEAKKVLKSDERNVGALLNLATIFQQRGQFELATSVLDRAREIDPDEARVWINLGFVYLARDKRTEATEAFNRATQLRDDLPEAHNNLGALFVEANDFDAAIESLQKALALYPDFASAYLNLGNAYKGARKFKEAEQAYKKAQQLDPSLTDVTFNLGVLHLDNKLPEMDRLKRWEVARNYFEKYLKNADGLSEDETKRVQSYITEADRGLEREKKAIEREERRRLREAKRKAREAEQAQEEEAPPTQTEGDADASKGSEAPAPGAGPR